MSTFSPLRLAAHIHSLDQSGPVREAIENQKDAVEDLDDEWIDEGHTFVNDEHAYGGDVIDPDVVEHRYVSISYLILATT